MSRPPLRLVINADDLGMSPAVNAAIFGCLEAGVVRSTTILANGPAVDDALRHARSFPQASFGVHLNLTEFAPLTTGLGRFVGTEGQLGRASLGVGPTDADAVLAEWSAQVARVRDAGVEISHFDSHQHLHHRPALFPVLRALQARFGVARVRGVGAFRPLPIVGMRAQLGALRQRMRAERFRARLRNAGAITTDGFASVAVFQAHAPRFSSRPPFRTFEVMVHPGNPHAAIYREEERAIAGDWLDGLPFPVTRVSWREIEGG